MSDSSTLLTASVKSLKFIKFGLLRPLLIFFFIAAFIIFNKPCNSTDIDGFIDFDVYSTISGIEKQVYNKEYSQENFYPRLERLEKSIMNSVYTDSIYVRLKRLQDVLSASKTIKQEDNRNVILDLLENRSFGFNYKEDSTENRLARLEECLFGKAIIGNIDYRFENLAKQMPASSQQNLAQSSNVTTEQIKDWKEFTSFADISLDNSDSDYYINIQRFDGKKVFKWGHFPILVYIYPESDNYIQNAKKAVQIWSEYIQIDLTNNLQDANILISWKKNYTDITKLDKSLYDEHILYSKDEKTKAYIYCGKYKESEYLLKFLTHQIGHSLGLWGHSNNKTDIMYPFKEFKNDINYRDFNNSPGISVRTAPYRPSTRDINTLIRMYHLQNANSLQ